MTRGVPRRDLTAEQARAALSYDPETGEMRHLRSQLAGEVAGYAWGGKNGVGYRGVTIYGKSHFAHRIAWLIFYGRWPEGHIDHINGDKSDNRLVNLREVPVWLNQHNRGVRRDSASGIKGVWQLAPDKWRAFIQVRGKTKVLGHFRTKEEAAAARARAGAEMLPACPVADAHFAAVLPDEQLKRPLPAFAPAD